jgi:hypothetical protein
MTWKLALCSTGPMSGKSTLAKYLEANYGFIRADHSRTLVEDYAKWLAPLTADEVYANKELYRRALQQHGYDAGFNDGSRMVYWVKRTLSEWLSFKPQRNVVFDSFRGEVQAQVMRDMGFEIVQLSISEDARQVRADELGRDYEQIVISMFKRPELELGVKNPDITLNAELPVEVLAKVLIDRPEHTQGYRIFGSDIRPH